MHETLEPIQAGITVVSTLGIGGALFAFGNMVGRRGGRTRSRGAADGSVERGRIATVTDNDARRRFEIRVDGELAGITEYTRTADTVTFFHTEIDPRFRGEGLAGKLISSALEASRNAGLSVQPVCPFVRAFIEKHPEAISVPASEPTNTDETMGCCELPS